MRSGQTFEMAVTDVVGRSQWFREYLEDCKLDTRGRVGTTRDNNFIVDTFAKSKKKGKGKYQLRSRLADNVDHQTYHAAFRHQGPGATTPKHSSVRENHRSTVDSQMNST